MGLKFLRFSSYLPSNIVKNEDFEKYLDTSDEWISSRTGIKERRFSINEDTSQLSDTAASKLNIIDKDKIDMVLVATFTADKSMPTIASGVQKLLDLREDIFTSDINMACSGFVAALNIAERFLENGRQAIVIGAEVISKYLDKEDRNTVVLFGDGAGAVLVEKNDKNSYFVTGTRTSDDTLNLSYKNIADKKSVIEMKGKEVFRFATEIVPKAINDLLTKANLDIEEIDKIVLHQANYRIIHSVAKKMNMDLDKFYMNMDKYGNTSAATIPIVLSEMNEKGLLEEGQKVIMVGFGAGLCWAGTLIEW